MSYVDLEDLKLEDLKGLVISCTKGLEVDSEEVVFTLSDGRAFKMHHHYQCCEHVCLVDICGDIDDLIDAKIIHFDERTVDPTDEELVANSAESLTWTFYDIQTNKGSVNLRWDGESNGYYSESVDIDWINQ